MSKIKLRDYQQRVVEEGIEKLSSYHYLYLALEMRLGKTMISMSIADRLGKKHVLFVTVKKAIPSIKKDYEALGPLFNLTVVNYESVKGSTDHYDLVILDEAHSLGAFPKPSGKAKDVYKITSRCDCDIIYLSGTPSIESSSQLFHQLYMSPHHPFRRYKNFYSFFSDYGIPRTKRIAGGMEIADYSKLSEGIVEKFLAHAAISLTKEEANFTFYKPNVKILEVEMSIECKTAYDTIKKDGIYKKGDSIVIADSSVKVMSKLQQISGGSVIDEDGGVVLLDSNKILEAKKLARGKKTVIFHRYQGELLLLKRYIKNHTTNVEEWQEGDSDDVLFLQTRTGSRGIDLSMADLQIYISIEFNGEAWTQGIDRQAHMNRSKPYDVIVLLSTNQSNETVDHRVFEAVNNKQDFNTELFNKLSGKEY